jgi:hypothetical protein
MVKYKQSVVEYLEQFLRRHCNPTVCDIEYSEYKMAFEQAKEMESQKDAKYNEMLEMLKIIVNADFNDSSWNYQACMDKARQLIKEATEI